MYMLYVHCVRGVFVISLKKNNNSEVTAGLTFTWWLQALESLAMGREQGKIHKRLRTGEASEERKLKPSVM